MYRALAYYLFTPIEDPALEVARHKAFCLARDIRCRVYISAQGINGQMSASEEASRAYQEWLHEDPRFAAVVFKVHPAKEHAFPRQTIKTRRQLVALDAEVDLALTAPHLSPEQWREKIRSRDEKTLVLDVRNQYEWAIGHFEGSDLPPLETFREFPAYARALKEQWDPKETEVLMCCTGGIRCEVYSALMKQEGFERVYQLEGGIINYGLTVGGDEWKGKLFVFDDRLAVALDGSSEGAPISSCAHCFTPSDVYHNCANVDCNALFLSCPVCAERLRGCCSAPCTQAPRLRLYEPVERPKPFRRQTAS